MPETNTWSLRVVADKQEDGGGRRAAGHGWLGDLGAEPERRIDEHHDAIGTTFA